MRTDCQAMKDYYLRKARLCRKRASDQPRQEARVLLRLAAMFEAAAKKCESPN